MNHDERLCGRPRAMWVAETDRGATHADFAPTHLYFRKAKCLWDINVRQRCANTESSLLDGRGAPTPLLSRSTPAVRGAFAKGDVVWRCMLVMELVQCEGEVAN